MVGVLHNDFWLFDFHLLSTVEPAAKSCSDEQERTVPCVENQKCHTPWMRNAIFVTLHPYTVWIRGSCHTVSPTTWDSFQNIHNNTLTPIITSDRLKVMSYHYNNCLIPWYNYVTYLPLGVVSDGHVEGAELTKALPSTAARAWDTTERTATLIKDQA